MTRKTSLDETREFLDFVENKVTPLLNDPNIIELFNHENISEGSEGRTNIQHFSREPLNYITSRIAYLAQDSLLALNLIRGHYNKSSRILEIGGGLGLAHIWLQSNGYDIISLEPSGTGYEYNYIIGQALIKKMGLDPNRWLSLKANEAHLCNKSFDLIFSFNVLEHLDDLFSSLRSMSKVMNSGGIMRHSCPNYFIPYEPHFGVFFPRLFSKCNVLTKNKFWEMEIWRSLNFITHKDIETLAKNFELTVDYDQEVLWKSMRRLDLDLFKNRHPLPSIIYKILKTLRLFDLLKYWPSKFSTPISFTLSKQ